jgi:hypothetical protein
VHGHRSLSSGPKTVCNHVVRVVKAIFCSVWISCAYAAANPDFDAFVREMEAVWDAEKA